MSKQAYTFRLYPTRKQAQALQWTLDRCRELYNAALQERRDAYRMCGTSITYYDQANQLPEIKQIREEYQAIHSQVLQDVLRRVKKAFDAFFRRCTNAEEPGYPRFQGKNRYDSFCYPQGGYSLTADHRVCLSKIGSMPSDGGFRHAPEKPRGFSPGESSHVHKLSLSRYPRCGSVMM